MGSADPAPPTPDALRARFRQIRGGAGENWKIRVHRSISWFRHAREFGEATEARFLFHWIAFNSLYGEWDPERGRPAEDARARLGFLRWIGRCDRERLERMVTSNRGLIRQILSNKCLSDLFWRDATSPAAKRLAVKDASYVNERIAEEHYLDLLKDLFMRLALLRGQLAHGASTVGSRKNRTVIKHATWVLDRFVPWMIDTVIEKGMDEPWPPICYPPTD